MRARRNGVVCASPRGRGLGRGDGRVHVGGVGQRDRPVSSPVAGLKTGAVRVLVPAVVVPPM